MSLSRRSMVGLGVLGASVAVTGGVVLFRDSAAVRSVLGDVTPLKGYAGGEKMAFVQNPRPWTP